MKIPNEIIPLLRYLAEPEKFMSDTGNSERDAKSWANASAKRIMRDADCADRSMIPVRISGKDAGWMKLKPDAEKSLVKAAMGHEVNPTASLAIRVDTKEIVEVDLCWPRGITERPSDYQILRDAMAGSQRLAGARFTEKDADELCEMIRQRATLPSQENVQRDAPI